MKFHLTEELYDKINAEAYVRYCRHNRGVRGQPITHQDDYAWWIAQVAGEMAMKLSVSVDERSWYPQWIQHAIRIFENNGYTVSTRERIDPFTCSTWYELTGTADNDTAFVLYTFPESFNAETLDYTLKTRRVAASGRDIY